MKNLILAALAGAALALGSVAVKQKLDHKAMGELREDYTPNADGPRCLLQRDGGEMYVITDVDPQAKTYHGVRQVLMLMGEFEIQARDMNERPDLKLVPCQ